MKKSHVFIIFADISFLLCGILCVGYIFVNVKKKHEPENELVENNILFEKGIEFPKMDGELSRIHTNPYDSMNILVPREGGKFLIDGKSILRSELAMRLENTGDRSISVSIDKAAPSGDTLYLFSILNKFNSNVSVSHIPEE